MQRPKAKQQYPRVNSLKQVYSIDVPIRAVGRLENLPARQAQREVRAVGLGHGKVAPGEGLRHEDAVEEQRPQREEEPQGPHQLEQAGEVAQQAALRPQPAAGHPPRRAAPHGQPVL